MRARSGAAGAWAEARLFVADKRLFVLERQVVLATVIKQVVVGYLGEVGPQVLATAQLPAVVAETFEHVGPGRLDHVRRVELGPQPWRQTPPHHDAKDRFEGPIDVSDGVQFTSGQPLHQTILNVFHTSSGLEPPGRPEIPSSEVASSSAAG